MEGTRQKQDQAEEGVQQQCGLAALTLEIKWRVGVLPCAAKWVGVYTLPLLVIEVTHAGGCGSAAEAIPTGADSWRQEVLSSRGILVTQLCVHHRCLASS